VDADGARIGVDRLRTGSAARGVEAGGSGSPAHHRTTEAEWAALTRIHSEIIGCHRCPRLRRYCAAIAIEKRAAYRGETYWARPVPGFGDAGARIVLIGLAPAAHGANRTGRVFTGDGAGGSGDFLMAALHANGLSNQSFSRAPDDALALRDVWIASAVRCAPPENRPTPAEIAACHPHLASEVAALPRARVFVALGRLAFDACCRLLAGRGTRISPRPLFEHGSVYRCPDGSTLIASYHPSRQNTHTGRLTPAMLSAVMRTAKRMALS
jgi:uracil-DNA glycosylase family 4